MIQKKKDKLGREMQDGQMIPQHMSLGFTETQFTGHLSAAAGCCDAQECLVSVGQRS
jgi:hypothetical protein